MLGEVQKNPGTTFIFHFPVGVWLVSRNKAEKRTITPGNLMLISILYQIIMILGDSIWLGGFKLEDEVFDVYDVDAKYLECRYDEDFIMYDRHE